MSEYLPVRSGLAIPLEEIRLRFSRSGGAGGQNVNKVNTKVTLSFDIAASSALSPEQKALLQERLANRISRQGFLQISASEQRSQGANREAALSRFADLIRAALHQQAARKPTRMSKAVKKRLALQKQQRSVLKKQRRKNKNVSSSGEGW